MHILREADLINYQAPSAITIGAFDGVHKGHQLIFKQLKQTAKKEHLKTVVVTFEPLPKEFFLNENAPKRLSPFRDRIGHLKSLGIDYVLCLQFNQKLQSVTAESFITKILVNGLNMKHILVGDDFKFGQNQQGDITLLKSLAKQYSYTVDKIPSFTCQNERISSSKIRTLISKGNFRTAQQYLGYPYYISGRIIHGDKNGRTLGFSTMNIALKQPMVVAGVYVVKAYLDNQNYYGVANVGTRPTVKGMKRLLEVHVFNFNQTVYRKLIKVEFLHWLRNEVKFPNLEALKAQIKEDINKAEQWLGSHNTQ
ncbi:bifunctional riboflavin kinase/FAD synthetase [Thiotrichales bacterium 19S11-10]|nr:bifunctional riboflavin kinase/FAD synthetase [Thiotrichales bacterium 19S11-10]